MPASPIPFVAPMPRRLLVADSFRVRDGERGAEVRGFSLHMARFQSAVAAAIADSAVGNDADDNEAPTHSNIDSNELVFDALPTLAPPSTLAIPPATATLPTPDASPKPTLSPYQLDDFLADAATQIAAAGEGFPRLELWATGVPGRVASFELSLTLRPLPEIRNVIDLRTAALPAIVTRPARKGPNIAAYSKLARELECEVLLVDDHGAVIEGTTTSLVWWDTAGRGFVSASPRRVSSVTEALVARIARGLGTPLSTARITPERLEGCAVWAVNALHGIRPVLTIDGRVLARQDPDRLAQYRSALDGTWEPVRA